MLANVIGALVPVFACGFCSGSGRMQGIEAALHSGVASPQCVFKYAQEAENSMLSDLSLPLVTEEHHL